MSEHPLADEAFEPYEPRRPVPLPVYWMAIALALWGAVTLWNDSTAQSSGVGQRLAEAGDMTRRHSAAGADLFAQRCATCHQADGAGVAGAVPPLQGSRFLGANPQLVVQILLHGINGPIAVGGDRFDGHMPAFGSVLDDGQIARLVTHLRATWGNGGEVDAAFVKAQRQATRERHASWNGGADLVSLDPAVGPQPAFLSAPPAPSDSVAMALARGGKAGGWACAACHGAAGEGRSGVPRLAGLPADYIAQALLAFSTGTRASDIMGPIARQLDGPERVGLGRLYATMASASRARPELDGDLARGATLALQGDDRRDVPSCFSCHGPSGFGVAPIVPAIAAQQPAYTAGRLAALGRHGKDDAGAAVMPSVAARLSDADRRAVADYLATLPPSPAIDTDTKDAR
ncbi:MAG: c-type cytochrome [Sphingomonadales bacterium]|nr:c-type cytochrome [Sphingomonadales bacterium]MDE2170408.1 c-type cytochrome [Sphingomonadales bacterium]